MLQITFLNITKKAEGAIKSGESTLIRFPHGTVMLIDAGVPESGPMLRDRIRELGVDHIDHFVLTHFHIDHIGGAPCILDAFPVGQVWSWPVDYFAEDFTRDRLPEFAEALRRHGLVPHLPYEGDTLTIDGVRVDVLAPYRGFPRSMEAYRSAIDREFGLPYFLNPKEPTVPYANDTSICLKLTYGKGSYLTCGDLYYPQERRLVRDHRDLLGCTLAKVNHHGAYTSSTKAWIAATHPQAVCAMRDSLPPVPKPQWAPFWKANVDSRPEKDYPAAGCAYYHTFVNGEVTFSLKEDGTFTVRTATGTRDML